ncbi:MAG: penicillin-binding protein activator [Reinekea sp.]
MIDLSKIGATICHYLIKDMSLTRRTNLLNVTVTVTLTILAGCTSQGVNTGSTPTTQTSQRLVADPLVQQQLAAVEALILQQQSEEAQIILNGLDFKQMAIEQQTRYVIAKAEVALINGDGQAALTWLNGQYVHLFDSLPQEKLIEISLKRAQAYELTGDMLASTRERIFLDPVLPEDQRKINQDQIWYDLALVSDQDLQVLVKRESSPDLTGWAELSLLSRSQTEDLHELVDRIEQWQRDNPTHPAAIKLPGSLQILREIATSQPRNIGVLLPLSGSLEKAGNAIRDGFLAAWHQASNNQQTTPNLHFYDTSSSEDIQSLYNRAVQEGADMIIGPLAKSRVQTLSSLPDLPAPILALNYADRVGTSIPNFYQFGLAPEDEAKQVADDIWQQGARNVLVIAPNSNWGIRVSDAFIKHWQLKGGTIASKAMFTQPDQYLGSIKKALNIDASERRHQLLQRRLGKALEFESRRRQDVDLVFLLAFPAQARQLKPLLTYQRAGDIPIAAISTIYSGHNDPDKDADLNGIHFVEMPWRLKSSDLKEDIQSAFPGSLNSYASLVALGIDAYRLYPRLQQMSLYNDVRIQGSTGLMSMNDAGQIERLLDWADFENGLVKAKPNEQWIEPLKSVIARHPNLAPPQKLLTSVNRKRSFGQQNIFSAAILNTTNTPCALMSLA